MFISHSYLQLVCCAHERLDRIKKEISDLESWLKDFDSMKNKKSFHTYLSRGNNDISLTGSIAVELIEITLEKKRSDEIKSIRNLSRILKSALNEAQAA